MQKTQMKDSVDNALDIVGVLPVIHRAGHSKRQCR